MNIIEREIKKREDLISECEAKLAEADELEARAAAIKAEFGNIDKAVLAAEIDELRAFLVQDSAPDEGVSVDAQEVL